MRVRERVRLELGPGLGFVRGKVLANGSRVSVFFDGEIALEEETAHGSTRDEGKELNLSHELIDLLHVWDIEIETKKREVK